jgi:hemin uptake protein HemP
MKYKDLTGQQFGLLKVIKFHMSVGRIVWECQCDSPAHQPKTVYITSDKLLGGRQTSCGCKRALKKDAASASEIKRKEKILEYKKETREKLYAEIKKFLLIKRNHVLATTFEEFMKFHNAHSGFLNIQCHRGHHYQQTWVNLQKETGNHKSLCRECYVMDYLTGRGWKFINYDKDTGIIKALCKGDHEVSHLSAKFFQPSGRCQKCVLGEPTKSKQSTIDIIRNRGYIPPEIMPEKLYHQTKFTVLCSKGHEYLTSRYNLVYGMRCPQCIESRVISDAELEIREWLNYNNIKFTPNQKFGVTSTKKGMEIDLFLPEHNLGIEHHGCYYHSDVKLRNVQLHAFKFLKSKKLGFRLLQIFEDEWQKQKEITKKIILKLTKNTLVLDKLLTPKRISQDEALAFAQKNYLWAPEGLMVIGFFDSTNTLQACLFLTSTGSVEILVEWVETVDSTLTSEVFIDCMKHIPTGAKLVINNRIPFYHNLQDLGFTTKGYQNSRFWYVKGSSRQLQPETKRKIYDAGSTLWGR